MNTPEKIYYSIREVSEMLDLPYSTLRYWETQFEQLKPHTNRHQTRFYTPSDVDLIRKIKYLREEQHLAIPAIQNRLKANTEVDYRYQIAENLKNIRKELVELRSMM